MYYNSGAFDELHSGLGRVVSGNEENTGRFLNAAKAVAFEAWAETDMADKFYARCVEMVKKFERMKEQTTQFQHASMAAHDNAFGAQRKIVNML